MSCCLYPGWLIGVCSCLEVFAGDLCPSSPNDPNYVKVIRTNSSYQFKFCSNDAMGGGCIELGSRPVYRRFELERKYQGALNDGGGEGVVLGPGPLASTDGARALAALTIAVPLVGLQSIASLPFKDGAEANNSALALGAALDDIPPGTCHVFKASSSRIRMILERALQSPREARLGGPAL